MTALQLFLGLKLFIVNALISPLRERNAYKTHYLSYKIDHNCLLY